MVIDQKPFTGGVPSGAEGDRVVVLTAVERFSSGIGLGERIGGLNDIIPVDAGLRIPRGA